MKFNKGSELDKQIYKEGESTWGCKSGVLDVEDIRDFIADCEMAYLKKFGMGAGMSVIKIMKEKAGKTFV